MSEPIPSPCIAVCALDEDDICIGCYRSGDEITDWFMACDEQKREILRRCDERRRAAQPVQLS